MDGIKHLLLLLSGLCSLSSCVPQHRYAHFKNPLTWPEAQSYCRKKCLDLATMDDISEVESGLETMRGKYHGAAWIGLWRGNTATSHWSLADKHFYKDGERSYMILSPTMESNCGGLKTSTVVAVPCKNLQHAICFDGEKQGREQYVLSPQSMRWTSARDYCRTHHSDLASVRNDAEFQIIQELAGDLLVWIGLYRDFWEWSDQTYSSLRYWQPSQTVNTRPTNTCAIIWKSGRWGKRPCSEKHQFLCNCPIVSSIKLRISSRDSALELNEPAVQENTLKRIEEELRKSVKGVIKLKWKKHPDGRVFIKELPGSD